MKEKSLLKWETKLQFYQKMSSLLFFPCFKDIPLSHISNRQNGGKGRFWMDHTRERKENFPQIM